MTSAVRFAVGTLSIVPVGAGRTDRTTAGRAMLVAPLVGAVLGAGAGALGLGTQWLGMSPLLSGVLVVAALVVLTRALHLDGLADFADGLGSARPAPDALAVMRRSDVGPFGVVVLVLVLLVQVAAVAQMIARRDGMSALVVAVMVSRASLTLACRRGVPAARLDGLGAHVAGTVAPLAAAAVAAVVVLAAAGAAELDDVAWGRGVAAAVLGLAAGHAVVRLAVRRLGGITGDVLGAVVETSAAVALIAISGTVD